MITLWKSKCQVQTPKVKSNTTHIFASVHFNHMPWNYLSWPLCRVLSFVYMYTKFVFKVRIFLCHNVKWQDLCHNIFVCHNVLQKHVYLNSESTNSTIDFSGSLVTWYCSSIFLRIGGKVKRLVVSHLMSIASGFFL